MSDSNKKEPNELVKKLSVSAKDYGKKFISQVQEVGSSFEQVMDKISNKLKTSDGDLKNLQNSLLNISSSTGIAADSIGESFYSSLLKGIQGMDDTQNALNFTEGCAKLAKVSYTDLNTVIDSSAEVMKAYGLNASDTGK